MIESHYTVEPFRAIINTPTDYGYKKGSKEAKWYRTALKRSKVLGETYVRDHYTQIVGVEGLREKDGCVGQAVAPETNYMSAYYLILDMGLLQDLPDLRLVLHHELAHLLTFAYGHKDKWSMCNPTQMYKDGCSADLDRWTLHLHRAMESIQWRDGTEGPYMIQPLKPSGNISPRS